MNRPIPFWFPVEELETLSVFLRQEHLQGEWVDDLRLELDVAKIRVTLLSINATSLSQALGYKNAVPIYMNTEEKNFLLSLPNLPEYVKERVK